MFKTKKRTDEVKTRDGAIYHGTATVKFLPCCSDGHFDWHVFIREMGEPAIVLHSSIVESIHPGEEIEMVLVDGKWIPETIDLAKA